MSRGQTHHRHDHHDRGDGGHRHSHGDGGHGHTHGGVDPSLLDSAAALRTLWVSLLVLGATAAVQVAVVMFTGSVALLADTVHNIGDALTAVPLAAAFLLGRRPPNRRFTYGYGRAEDIAGIAVLLVILFSAVYAAYEAGVRLVDPSAPDHLLAVALAGVVGFIGNEWVAVYRIRTGRRIGSAALVADGHHARIDGFTSLAVVAGAAGVALGQPLADPIVGLLIAAVIVRIVWVSAREIGLRLLDGIEPERIEQIRSVAASTPGVLTVEDARARWSGHRIRAELRIGAAGDLTIGDSQALVEAVARNLRAAVAHLGAVSVQVDAVTPD
ncbi:MAG: cation diffusion facilitator family transporter [Thermoleophilia bacterium]